MLRLRLDRRYLADTKKIVTIDEYFNLPLIKARKCIVQPRSSMELREAVSKAISMLGDRADLNFIDTHHITEMNDVFYDRPFNGDISKWDTSNVKYMSGMFMNSKFNGDISNWDVSKVRNMRNMFNGSQFNGDISKWDVSSVTDMRRMFSFASFNGDISNWNVSKVLNMEHMFYNAEFSGDLSKWNISKDCDTNYMFYDSPLEEKYGRNANRLTHSKGEADFEEYFDKLFDEEDNPGVPEGLKPIDGGKRAKNNTVWFRATFADTELLGKNVELDLVYTLHLDTNTMDITIYADGSDDYENYFEKGIQLPTDYSRFKEVFIKETERAFDSI